MISLKTKQRLPYRTAGFTVVELLVTLVVIAILVSVVIVSYGTYQERTRDAERKSDVHQIAAALKNHANWQGTFIETGSGCGNSGTGRGWVAVSSVESSSYETSIEQCLVNAKYLKPGDGVDPTGCIRNSGGICGTGNPTRAYMKTHCTVGGVKKAYVMASLETAPANNAVIDALCSTNYGTNYGMNYYVEVS